MRMKIKRAMAVGLLMAAILSFNAYGAQWIKAPDGSWIYQNDDGTHVTDGFTPDGYYINGTGKWQENTVILDTNIPNRNSFRSPAEEKIFDGCDEIFNQVQRKLYRDIGNARRFQLSNTRLRLNRVEDEKSTELFSLEQDPQAGEFKLTIRCGLTREYSGDVPMSWYNFQCLRVALNLLSRTGDQLADAVYYSWEGDNRYGVKLEQWTNVGDAQISYRAADGAGVYSIRPAF